MKMCENHAGKRFGELVALYRCGTHRSGSALWLCQCDCGAKKLVASRHLKRGEIVSCGCKRRSTRMMKKGDVFGRLTVVEPTESRGHSYYFKFSCSCGKTLVANGNAVKRGMIKSCGCWRREFCKQIAVLLPGRDGKAGYRYFYKGCKARAKHHGLVFLLSSEDHERLIKSDCFYCGSPPSTGLRKRYADCQVNGVDRLDSNEGYVAENCVSCCVACNRAKSGMSIEEFGSWVEKVYKHLSSFRT